ncbi:MAG TPA: DNA polymerase IV [Planctomycetota bacterium]|nr:DNA polymerase IV [Planctomycetota bacterium]
MKNRIIMHVDMDAFFASVEQAADPSLKGKPVMVCGGLESRTVVAAASYEARKFGVRAAMPLAIARMKCPNGVFIEGDPEKYIYTSLRLNDIFREFSPIVEEYSIDESFLDVTDVAGRFGGPAEIAKKIKQRVKEQFHLSCSVGIGPNKLLAKTASDLDKPDGLTVLAWEDLPAKFQTLPVEKLYGVGEETAKKLELLGVHTIGQLANVPVSALKKIFGVVGELLHDAANGIDNSPVLTEAERPPPKSVGNDYTLQRDTLDDELIRSVLLGLCSKVARRLRKGGHAGRTVTLKIRFSDFTTITRSRTLDTHVDLDKEIFDVVLQIYQSLHKHMAVRMLGVSASNLMHTPPERQRSLFDYSFWKKYKRVIQSVDKARDKFGERSIMWGALIRKEAG